MAVNYSRGDNQSCLTQDPTWSFAQSNNLKWDRNTVALDKTAARSKAQQHIYIMSEKYKKSILVRFRDARDRLEGESILIIQNIYA